ncbi:MAG: hypothetical protein II059_08395 [Clostridia bacterium]|nr:hypothetical protein [Clostridia bacterium]
MKKNFSNAAEELITGIQSTGEDNKRSAGAQEIKGYLRYVEPRDQRMHVLLSKSLSDRLSKEAAKRKMSKNGLLNEILENYFAAK